MYDLDTARTANQREVTSMLTTAETLTDADWARPALPGWTITDLLDHCARALTQQAEAFQRGITGNMEPPPFPAPEPTTPSKAIADLRAGLDSIQTALGALQPHHLGQLTPMPFGVVPTPVALQIAVVEYAMHRVDLEHCTTRPDSELPDDAATTYIDMIPGILPMLAARSEQPPTGPLAFRFTTPEATHTLTFDGQQWAPTDTHDPTDTTDATVCHITGSAADVAMFYMGRLTTDDARLTITGHTDAADHFKQYFPGP